jgi:hypothetical protein
LRHDVSLLNTAGIRPTKGDLYCIGFGHLSRLAVGGLRPTWDPCRTIAQRMFRAECALRDAAKACNSELLINELASPTSARRPSKIRTPL